jgi:hypothetical protein
MNEVRIVPTHLALQQIRLFLIHICMKGHVSFTHEPRISLKKSQSSTSSVLRLSLIVMGRSCKM